ncbi:AbrB/MazE/SpoVT family DNA-binding domain-containing protein [bacterium]|nr:AbrB/MazE/SpoVT family DNA-binding domain-containing protein [bacterium]
MQIFSSQIKENGQITLPEQVRKLLGINFKKGNVVGLVVENGEIKIAKARVVKDTSLTPDEIALMADWSKKGKGKKSFKKTQNALKYLWSI